MDNCVKNTEELALAVSKKEILRRSYDLAHAQANSVLMFTVQWKDLEEHFDFTMKSLEKQSNDVDLKSMLLDERVREIESRESELVLVEKKIKQCNVELQLKEGELNLVKNSVEEWSARLDLKKEELGLVEKSNEKCRVEQRRVENLNKDCLEQIELKEKELGEIRSSIEECENELVMKRIHVASIQVLIKEYEEKLELKEKLFRDVKKSMMQCETKLECEKEELELTQTSIKELSMKLHLGEEKLESLQKIVRLLEIELHSKEEELDSMKEQMNKYLRDIELKEREFNGVRKCIEECSQELTLKEQQLKSVEISIKECCMEFQVKENELISAEKSILKCSEELELKKKQLYSEELELKKKQLYVIENSAVELSEKRISNELELDLIQTVANGYLKQLKEKENHFDSLEKALEDRLQELEVKERHFEERDKEFELREREFDSDRKAVEDRSKILELKEKNLPVFQVKIEQPESLTCNESKSTQRLFLQSSTMKNGRNLQLFLNQHLQKHDSIFGEIYYTLTKAHDPALLVLDAMQGFYPPHSREGDDEFDVSIIRRTCILLLEQLSSFAPEINLQVRDEAMKVAGEWKKKMRVTVENSLEVLGFLHLLAAYRLATAFDGNELESFLDVVAQHRQAPKLRQSLGFADKVPDLQCSTTTEGRSSLSFLNKHNLSHNEVLGILHMVPEPANYVLDLIQGSCSAHWKSQGAGFEEGVVKCYILFLKKLKEVLPKMNPQVKAEALKLAVEWKTKMGVVTENSLEVLVFLQLLCAFELVASFNREEIVELLWTIAQLKEAPEICQVLGFRDIVPDFVRNLIGRKKHVEAVRFICTFELTDIALPEALLKEYLEDTKRSLSDIYREGNNSPDAKDKTIDFEINALRVLTECIEENKLESLFAIETMKQHIRLLEKLKADGRHSALASRPMMQLATRKNYNAGSSPATHPAIHNRMNQPQNGGMNQPATLQAIHSRMNQPQHGGMNQPTTVQAIHSRMNLPQHGGMYQTIGSSAPWEQPLLQNCYKRPRVEPPTTRAYMPQMSASFNLPVQCGPAVAHSGRQAQFDHLAVNHSRATANIAGKQNPCHLWNQH